jgi:micrococcal nuclease
MPTCLPKIEAPRARVVRVEKNGTIVLADRRAVRLEGILLPAGTGDRAPGILAEQAILALEDMTANHTVDLAAAPPKEDRYGRIRAQVFVHTNGADVWLQKEMLRKGLARVAIAPDRGECAQELYAAEAAARRERAGLWSSPAYAIRTPSQAENDIGTFQIIEGTVKSVSRSGGRIFLDFASAEDTALVVTISTDDMKRFRQIGVDPYAYANERVRVRGWVERVRRLPEIALATPAQVEIVQTTHRSGAPP